MSKRDAKYSIRECFQTICTMLSDAGNTEYYIGASLNFQAIEYESAAKAWPALFLHSMATGAPISPQELADTYQLDLFIDNTQGSGTDEATADLIEDHILKILKIGRTVTTGSSWQGMVSFDLPGQPTIGYMELRWLGGFDPVRPPAYPKMIHRRARFQIIYKP